MYKDDLHHPAIYYKPMGYFLLEISFHNVFMINYYFMLCSEICNGDFYKEIVTCQVYSLIMSLLIQR